VMREIVLGLLLAVSVSAGELEVRVSGVRNAKGTVRALLFAGPEGFPEGHAHAVAKGQAKAREGEVVLHFKDVEVRRGAIVIIHDEDDNTKLRKNFLGIPREGVGASNWNGRGRPKFKRTVIDLPAGGVVGVRMRYP